jgi:hypothetical protein
LKYEILRKSAIYNPFLIMTPLLKEAFKDVGDIRGYRGNFKGDEKKPRVWYYYEVEVTKRAANNQIIIGFAQKDCAEITDCVGNERWSDIKPGECAGTVGFDINSGKLSISGGLKWHIDLEEEIKKLQEPESIYRPKQRAALKEEELDEFEAEEVKYIGDCFGIAYNVEKGKN